jgi:hypothetical protein
MNNTETLSPSELQKLALASTQLHSAIAAIRDEHLYRATHADFNSYLRDEIIRPAFNESDIAVVDTACPKGGTHEWVDTDSETFCRNCDLLLDTLHAYSIYIACGLRDKSRARAERVWLAVAGHQAVMGSLDDDDSRRLSREINLFAVQVGLDLAALAFPENPSLIDKATDRARTVLAKVAKFVDRFAWGRAD